MQRMFAFTYDSIGEDDLIVTSDADAFVVDPHIFKDLRKDFRVSW